MFDWDAPGQHRQCCFAAAGQLSHPAVDALLAPTVSLELLHSARLSDAVAVGGCCESGWAFEAVS